MTAGKKKSYFGDKPKGDNTLYKIIFVIVLIGAIVVGGFKVSNWFQNKITGHIEASAPERLENAQSLLEADNPTQALEEIQSILDRVDNPDISPKAILMHIEIVRHQQNNEAVEGLLKSIIDQYPDAPEYPQVAVEYARLLEEQGKMEESLALYKTIYETVPSSMRAPGTTAMGREKERQSQPYEAIKLYKQALTEAPYDSAEWEEAAGYLGDLNTSLLFSQSKTPDSKSYVVVSGDSLTSIGSKLNITQGQLLRANGMTNPNTLRLNQMLKYTPKDFNIVIERSTCRIYLMDGQGLFKMYKTGLGRPEKQTTKGRYKVGNKEKNPTWHKPGAVPIPPGDPENELGSRWLPLIPEEAGLPTDLGIHGTIHPDSIGKYSSSGCPRMHNAEVEELYDLVVRSTPVQILETFTPPS